MKFLNIFLPLIAVFGLNACISGSNNYYVLSVASKPQTVYHASKMVIGVDKVTVPGYLYKREIAIAKSNNQITLLGNAKWGEDLDSGLTQRLISFLQKKFHQPNVYAYPWDIDHQPNIKVSVQITRFIAQGDRVYLDATWRVENMKTHKRKAKLFSTVLGTNSNVETIVSSMSSAFSQLEEAVANGVRHF